MFGLLKKAGLLGGLAALARSSKGQQYIACAKAYATDPETRRKLDGLRSKFLSRTTSRDSAPVPASAPVADPVRPTSQS